MSHPFWPREEQPVVDVEIALHTERLPNGGHLAVAVPVVLAEVRREVHAALAELLVEARRAPQASAVSR